MSRFANWKKGVEKGVKTLEKSVESSSLKMFNDN